MRIILAGGNGPGRTLARNLTRDGHNPVVFSRSHPDKISHRGHRMLIRMAAQLGSGAIRSMTQGPSSAQPGRAVVVRVSPGRKGLLSPRRVSESYFVTFNLIVIVPKSTNSISSLFTNSIIFGSCFHGLLVAASIGGYCFAREIHYSEESIFASRSFDLFDSNHLEGDLD